MKLRKIISGAQTGADRAALDVALAWPFPIGGYVPKGRIAEDGFIPTRYEGLSETASEAPEVRTRRNVSEADGTLIVARGPLHGGSKLTFELAAELGKPCLHLDVDGEAWLGDAVRRTIGWLEEHDVAVLNVAGPRARTARRSTRRSAASSRACWRRWRGVD